MPGPLDLESEENHWEQGRRIQRKAFAAKIPMTISLVGGSTPRTREEYWETVASHPDLSKPIPKNTSGEVHSVRELGGKRGIQK